MQTEEKPNQRERERGVTSEGNAPLRSFSYRALASRRTGKAAISTRANGLSLSKRMPEEASFARPRNQFGFVSHASAQPGKYPSTLQ
ncbi:hypothetical protein SAMN05444392_1231 [Seinonella peptonophila]|uniref:Uncharacterized protein n=1 Tax=Seinonella peptonophila TaxID=112248 RepID=A0A1M5BF73_9BACL|nr:hypothetical protein SAMN05444392_1231 [Seinonella peptonophila]